MLKRQRFCFRYNLKRTMKQRSLFLILCFVFIGFGVASVSAQTCMDNGYFRSNGTYDANRRLILSSLPSNVTAQEGFFYNGSIGQEPNRVYARGMCIPGSTSEDCSDCIKTASDGLIQSCPNRTEAYWWRGEPTLCLVHYSNTSFSGSANLNPRVVLTNTGDINSNLTEFTKIWEDLVVRMIDVASTAKSTPSSSNNYYTANKGALGTFQDIYALMQCTPDLSSGDCESCLQQSARDYQSCCGQKQGGVVMGRSCFFRWDLYTYSKASFENITVASPPPLPHSAGDGPNTADNDGYVTSFCGSVMCKQSSSEFSPSRLSEQPVNGAMPKSKSLRSLEFSVTFKLLSLLSLRYLLSLFPRSAKL